MKPKLLKTVHIMSLTVVAAVVALAGYAFLWLQIDSVSNEVSATVSDLKVAAGRSRSAVLLEKALEDSAAYRQTVDTYFIPAGGEVSFVEFMESLGQTVGTKVSIKSIGFDQGATDDFKKALSVTADLNGSWNNLMRFLSMIESVPYHIDITSANIDANSDKSSSKEWHALVTVKVLELK